LRPQAVISSKDLRLTHPVSGLHQAPLDSTEVELDNSYLHMHFSSHLLFPSIKKFFGGYEIYAEPMCEITPEAAAAYLRRSAAQLSVCSPNFKASESKVPVGSVLVGLPEINQNAHLSHSGLNGLSTCII